jgi:hypothetical protein
MILLFFIPLVYVFIDFVYFINYKKTTPFLFLDLIFEIVSVIGYPLFFLFFVDSGSNDCCNILSSFFSPSHKLTILVIIFAAQISYIYCSWFKREIKSPIFEVLLNCILFLGIVVNTLLVFHLDLALSAMGNIPIIILFIRQLFINHQYFVNQYQAEKYHPSNKFNHICWKILSSHPIWKFPILFLLCFPLLIILSGILLLFGQKPDSAIRAFTDTYKHGLSQLDYLCKNVDCGDHYLCSVAANGHSNIVKPIRYGTRKGGKIICNRQLLVSNAFEELIEQKLPKTHRFIRKNYNKVGNVIHKHYTLFNNKLLADLIYILMKPLEWFFLLILYTFDKNPESRIAQQYLNQNDRKAIKSITKSSSNIIKI